MQFDYSVIDSVLYLLCYLIMLPALIYVIWRNVKAKA